MYDTAAESPSRYLNDHTLIKGRDGLWHLFGITGDTPPPGVAPDSRLEDELAHATAPDLRGPWTTRPYALTVDPGYHGEDHLWAPHVIEHDGTYYMFYAAGLGQDAAINLATSTDLFTWTRHPAGPLFRDGLEARDPYVTRVGDQWVMYYTATSTPDGGNHVVAYRTSANLVDWSGRQIAYTDPTTTANSGPVTESPFVVERDGWWYMFIGPRRGVRRHRRLPQPGPAALRPRGLRRARAGARLRGDSGRRRLVDFARRLFQRGQHLAPLRWRDTPPPWQSTLNPTVAHNADGRLEVFTVSADGASILRRAQTAPNGGWGAWQTFGDAAAAAPSVGKHTDGTLEVFALSPYGSGIAHRFQTAPSGAWGEWRSFGTWAGAAPSVLRNADGRLEVFAIGPGNDYVAHRWQTAPNGQWSDWRVFGGPAQCVPSGGNQADGRLTVFALQPGGRARGLRAHPCKIARKLRRVPKHGQLLTQRPRAA